MTHLRIGSFLAMACMALALGTTAAGAQGGGAPVTLADAAPGSVRIFASGAMRAPLMAIRGSLEKATGHPVVMEITESRTLQKKIEAGQAFEVALLTTEVIQGEANKGKIAADSVAPLAVVRLGVSARGDIPKLDVTTPDGVKKAILGAHSIRRFYGVAATSPMLDNLFAKLGVTEATKDRMVEISNDKVVPEEPLPPGQYELVMNLVSAVMPMKGWTYLGLAPEQFQMPIAHSLGIGATGDRAAAQKMAAVLQGPEFDAALKTYGITRR